MPADHLSGSNSQTSSLHFASQIEGNMGATLSGSWATGDIRDTEEIEDIQFSNNSLLTGLLNPTQIEGDVEGSPDLG